MYTTNSAEQCELILTDCEAKVVVVENKQQLEKVLQSMKNSKCRVNKIVQYIGEPEDNHNGLVINVRHSRFMFQFLNQKKIFFFISKKSGISLWSWVTK